MTRRPRRRTSYRPVKIPEAVMAVVETLVAAGTFGYRTPAEFIVDAVRRRLEELGYIPAGPAP